MIEDETFLWQSIGEMGDNQYFMDPDNDLIDLIKKRTNIYSKALYEIKCDNLTKNEIVSKIKEIYETN